MTGMVRDLKANPERMRAVASADYSVATDLADWLVREVGLPFRQAHHVDRRAGRQGRRQGRRSRQALARRDAGGRAAASTKDVYSVLTVEASVAARKSYGGTAPANVARAVQGRAQEVPGSARR